MLDNFERALTLFLGREEELRQVSRYDLYDVMWYRSDLWLHSRRTAWITRELLPAALTVFPTSFDPNKALLLGLVHDDAEIIFGDINAGNKAKMSTEELEAIKEAEKNAIQILSQRFPKTICGFKYQSLLEEAEEKSTPEALVVNWADKMDAFGEALHEIYAGHRRFATNVENIYGRIDLPTDYYFRYFQTYAKKYPQASALLATGSEWFSLPRPEAFDIGKTVRKGTPHTEASVKQATGYAPYDRWVSLTLKHGTNEDISRLFLRREV